MKQNMQALDRANEVRVDRAILKRDVLSGAKTAASVIRDTPFCAHNMTLLELLASQRNWGGTRVRRFLFTMGAINEGKQIGTLTPRQRDLLSSELDNPTRGYP